MRIIIIMSILLLSVSTGISWAAGLSPAKAITPDRAWNPNPAPDDLILPMPCNGQLVLRAVEVPMPKNDFFYDQNFFMGISNLPDESRDYYERRFTGHVSAPLTIHDLPEAWRKILSQKADADKYLYYFIGKYEISTRQWRIVMENSCPTDNITEADLRPKTDISWYDMQDFFSKYMKWLIKENLTSLPVFADNDRDIGFLRLPTEEEWEFAARGGMRIPEEHRNQEDFYPLKEYPASQKDDAAADLKLGDFAIYRAGDRIFSEASPIGSRKPNPLLIYDMAGNVKELVQSAFQFSIAETQGDTTVRRRHGSTGGLVVKGGSFRSEEASILPGWRDEVPMFRQNGPVAVSDLGFRPVLSGINIPASAERVRMHQESGKTTLSKPVAPAAPDKAVPPKQNAADAPVNINPSGTLLNELDKVIQSTSSPIARDNLAKYRSMVADNLSAADRLRNDASMSVVRFALSNAQSLIHLAYRIRKSSRDYQELKDFASKNAAKIPQEKINEFRKHISDTKEVFFNVIDSYKQNLETLSAESPATLATHYSIISRAHEGSGLLDRHTRANLGALMKHLDQVRKKGIGSLTKQQIINDIVPQEYRQLDF